LISLVFKEKLAKLNKNLYVDDRARRQIRPGTDHYGSGLYCRNAVRTANDTSAAKLNYLDKASRTYIEDSQNGLLPDFLCGIPTGYIPEYDDIDIESGKLLARGWRSILMFLATKRRLISLDKARRVFACGSLGEQTYDHKNFEQKLADLRAEDLKKRRSALRLF
jgi:hypothetical protein